MLKRTRNVIVVEDEVAPAQAYASAIRLKAFDVEVANDAATAIALLDRRTFDAAVVDIHLAGLPGDRSGGLSVIEHIDRLGEGTSVVVLTGEKSTQFAADLVRDWHVFKFLSKDTVVKEGLPPLFQAVETAVEAAQLKLFGQWRSITQAVSGTIDDGLWVGDMLRHLSPQQGYPGLEQFLMRLLGAYLPLIAPPTDGPWIKWDKRTSGATGTFWGKGRGVAVDLLIGKSLKGNVSANGGEFEVDAHGVYGRVHELPALERERFRA